MTPKPVLSTADIRLIAREVFAMKKEDDERKELLKQQKKEEQERIKKENEAKKDKEDYFKNLDIKEMFYEVLCDMDYDMEEHLKYNKEVVENMKEFIKEELLPLLDTWKSLSLSLV